MASSQDRHFDFIVIGVGSMGSAACRYLAGRGHRVLGLEQFAVPHELGAHSGQTRLIRKAYYEHPDYIPLLIRSYELWKELERESGESVYEETGIFYAGPRGNELMEGVKASAKLYDIPLTVPSDLTQFDVPEGYEVLFEPEAGFLRPSKAIRLFAGLAERDGATIRSNERVIEWKVGGDYIEVTTDKDVYTAKKIVITAGPWAANLIPGITSHLKVTRQFVAWFDGDARDSFALGKFPCWAIVDDEAQGLYYGFPWLDAESPEEASGLKIAHHLPGIQTDPDAVVREILDGDVENLARCLRRFIPGAPSELKASKVCLYGNSPDTHFVIDNLPGLENYACVAWGFSGHGFKFASAVGEVLADLAENGATTRPISFLNASRFNSQ